VGGAHQDSFAESVAETVVRSRALIKPILELAQSDTKDTVVIYTNRCGPDRFELDDFKQIPYRRLGLVQGGLAEHAWMLSPAAYTFILPSEAVAENFVANIIRDTVQNAWVDDLFDAIPKEQAAEHFIACERDGLLRAFVCPSACAFPGIFFDPFETPPGRAFITFYDETAPTDSHRASIPIQSTESDLFDIDLGVFPIPTPYAEAFVRQVLEPITKGAFQGATSISLSDILRRMLGA